MTKAKPFFFAETIAGMALLYIVLTTFLTWSIMWTWRSGPNLSWVYDYLPVWLRMMQPEYVLRFVFPFLLLHLPILVAIWATLPRKMILFLPLLSGIMGIAIAFVLRNLKSPEPFADDSPFRFIAYIVTAVVAGFCLQRVTQQTERSATHGAVIATIGFCVPCLLFNYLVFPGRYVAHFAQPNRVDWLTGQWQKPIPPCAREYRNTSACRYVNIAADE
ncbi:MAG: hypothetical protein EOO39_47075 [Cytophagaceae bacterium]|nr:MAG: hypothetical protein EOO39_47075 [Cytophagaceae bacterium]